MTSEAHPKWLTTELLKSTLQTEYPGEEISIKDFHVSKAVPKGGGYLSDLNRVVLKYKRKNCDEEMLSLIIKSQPEDCYQLEFSKEIQAFKKEVMVYQRTLPGMYNLASLKLPEKIKKPLTPKSLICPKPDTLVLEDLKEKGYSVVDRRQRLDLEHSLLVVRTLADFHAMSLLLHSLDPKSMDDLIETHYTEANYHLVESFFELTFDALISNVKQWDGYERFVRKLEKLADFASDIMLEQCKPRKNAVSVLNHGDIWVNNLLFKHCPESGRPEEVKFVDFQLTKFSSPALDLHFFFYLSLQEDVLLNHLEELINEYYKELTNNLKLYGCDPNVIRLEELRKELKETERYALITACSKLWFVLVDPKHVHEISLPGDFARGMGKHNSLTKVYGDPLIRSAFEKLLPYFESRGTL